MSQSCRRLVSLAACAVGAAGAAPGALAASMPSAADSARAASALSAAPAATLTADQPCYVKLSTGKQAPMIITGSGFTPGGNVTLAAGGRSLTAAADSTGAVTFNAPVPAVRKGPRQASTTLTAVDAATGARTTLVVRSANLAVGVLPGRVHNVRRQKVTFTFAGFTPGRHIYGYYMHRGRIVARTRFGAATGPCGMLRQRALLYPGGRPRYDLYTLTFESTSHYSKSAFPFVTGTLRVGPGMS